MDCLSDVEAGAGTGACHPSRREVLGAIVAARRWETERVVVAGAGKCPSGAAMVELWFGVKDAGTRRRACRGRR